MTTPAFPAYDGDKPDWATQTDVTFPQSIRDNQVALLLMQFLGGGGLPAGWTKNSTVDGTGRLTQILAAFGALRFKAVFAYAVSPAWQLATRAVTWSNDSGTTWASAPGSGSYTYGANDAVTFTPT